MCINIVTSSLPVQTPAAHARLTEEICRQGHQGSALQAGRLTAAVQQSLTTQPREPMLMNSCPVTAAAEMMMVSHWQPYAVALPPPLNTFKHTSIRLGVYCFYLIDFDCFICFYLQCSFTSAAPNIWNSLPEHLRQCCDLEKFRRKLTTYPFSSVYAAWAANPRLRIAFLCYIWHVTNFIWWWYCISFSNPATVFQ